MSYQNVQFENQNINPLPKRPVSENSEEIPNAPILNFFVKRHLIRNHQQAYVFLIAVSVLLFLATVFVLFNEPETEITYWEDIPEEIRLSLPDEVAQTIPRRSK